VRVSEEFRLISTVGLKRTGNLEADALNFSKYCGREADTLPKVELRLALGDPLVVHQLTESVCKKSPVRKDRQCSRHLSAIFANTVFDRIEAWQISF